jgi:hypothetical protein
MEIRFVHKNHCFGRSFGYGIAHFIFRRNAGRWIIRVANIDQTSACGGKHFEKIVTETIGQWHLYYFSTIGTGIIEYRFESWVRFGTEAPEKQSFFSMQALCFRPD